MTVFKTLKLCFSGILLNETIAQEYLDIVGTVHAPGAHLISFLTKNFYRLFLQSSLDDTIMDIELGTHHSEAQIVTPLQTNRGNPKKLAKKPSERTAKHFSRKLRRNIQGFRERFH